ncbi:MAG: hypothetical protein IJG50_04380 [Clostridia bacterium]|nr:hypothetical protein [Clostridia bacterium]
MKKIVISIVIIIIVCALAGCSFSGGGSAKDGFPYDSLESDSVKSRDDVVKLSLDGEKLGELLAHIKTPAEYTWTCRVTYMFDEDEASYTVVKQVSGARERCDKYSSAGTQLMYSIYDGETLSVYDMQTGETLVREGFDSDYLGSTASLCDPVLLLKNGPSENISDITFEYEGADAVISFSYGDPELKFIEKYAVRASDGIPLRVESKLGEQTVYTLETVDIEYFVSNESVFS